MPLLVDTLTLIELEGMDYIGPQPGGEGRCGEGFIGDFWKVSPGSFRLNARP